MKRFGGARVETARLQAGNDAYNASDPFFSSDDTLINCDEIIAPVFSKGREDIMLVGGERVLQRADDYRNWGGFAYEWRRTPSVR
jgi:hypothetical protein